MDYSNLFNYDDVHTVDIRRPDNGEYIGIKIGVRSSESIQVVKKLRPLELEVFKRQREGDVVNYAEHLIELMAIKAKNVIVSWSFDEGASFGNLNNESEVNEDNIAYLVDHPNSGWVIPQIVGAADDIVNFTQPSPKIAPNTSKKK